MDIPFIYHSYTFNIFTARDLLAFQSDWINGTDTVRLDLELLKQFRVSAAATETIGCSGPPDRMWLEYAYCKHHTVLQYLPIKLAEWISENMWLCFCFVAVLCIIRKLLSNVAALVSLSLSLSDSTARTDVTSRSVESDLGWGPSLSFC